MGLCRLATGEHGEAIEADLIDRGYRRRDIGYRLSWIELRAILNWGRGTAYHRSVKPRSWWYTPEIAKLDQIAYVLAWANWQRAGKRGAPKPKPPKPPVDREASITTKQELDARKRRQRDHLRRRRAEIADAEARGRQSGKQGIVNSPGRESRQDSPRWRRRRAQKGPQAAPSPQGALR